ncbi:PLU-1-like protein domain-containing protein [Trichoderma breve]|uniref:PLU-1-like protein domain-containing protein n=1 Tax=Trichoderma breve TaxID=2034170 RepID=A0A9W9JQD4_9HYPO|nr:PLU-1-like protein domain-containing protein [Trichoderma breve]KAJ4863685.1 PLU-1-like protein domain-containing protein [Trichoderma breve]
MAPMASLSAAAAASGSANASSRSSPAIGASAASSSSKPKHKVNSNGYHPTNPPVPLSSMVSAPLDLTSVERRGQPTAVREPLKKKTRPHGISEAPTYCPTEHEWRDPLQYIQKIAPEASQFGICKIIPPDSWNPEFAIDTEKFHFRTRKQELNSVEGSTRANLTYLDGLAKFHKQQGNNLHRLPYVDKKPLDLYRLKKAVESRGGFDKRWLCPYEDYLRLAKPGVHQQLEQEYGGPLTPSPAPTPVKRSTVNTPSSARGASPARQASDALQNSVAGPTSGFTAINTNGGFTAVNSGFTSVNRSTNGESKSYTPDSKRYDSPATSTRNTPEARPSGLGSAVALKRQLSVGSPADSIKKEADTDKDDADMASRRSKRLKKDNVPTVAGSHMTVFRPSVPRIPREEGAAAGNKCENCGRGDDSGPLLRKPEAEWNCPRCLVGDGQFGFEEGGLYSLKQFQQKANDFKQGYFEQKMPFDETLHCHRPVTEEDVESEFWRLVADLEETVEVEYGADIHCTTHGSGFPTVEKHPSNPYATDPWNLNVLPFHQDSLFRHIKSDISGMTVPWVYVGMIFSTFCWHNEDHYAYSANYQHLGATKTWYGIPGEDAEKFETAMKEAVPELFETQPDLLFQLVTLLTPEQLKKAGVRVYALDQRAGQFVITFPQAYHAGFNHGFNFNEAVNFAPCDWEKFGQAGVERLQLFRRQPCFSHDELLWTAAEGSVSSGPGLTIQTAKWLAPALDRISHRERVQREEFLTKHNEASPHRCQVMGGSEDSCPLTFKIDDADVHDEDEQCCSYCKAFAYLSRFKCHRSGKILCIFHAGTHACCDVPEEKRLRGEEHTLIYRKTDDDMISIYQKVSEKARTPEAWEEKYEKLLDEEATPSLKTLRALLHEGEKIPYELTSLPILKEFVDKCNDWVEEATNYIVRKQQNRRKNEKVWQSNGRRGSANNDQKDKDKDKESRHVSNIHRLLTEAEHIGFDCPEIAQLQERAAAVKQFQDNATTILKQNIAHPIEAIEELIEEGRGFNIDTPELEALCRRLEELRWNEKARTSRGKFLLLTEVQEIIEEGKRLEIPSYNDHLKYYCDKLAAGQAWEAKARELTHAEFVHYPQLEALTAQVQANALPVSRETLAAVDQILHKQREAHRQIIDITDRCRDPDYTKRPKYSEVLEITRKLDDLNSKPTGTVDLENERKRHEDWMRRGKKLFGKSNAPLHILKSHLEHVLERNTDCFDTDHDTPRLPGEPVSREASPEAGGNRWEDPRSRQVFCICRKIEAGMMIECELCHEWYHYKCLKIARGKVKEDDKYTCPICDWRMKIPRDASRPKLEDLTSLADEIPSLPFQPEEEEVLRQIIDNAQNFRDKIAQYCNPLLSTEAEAETQRFFLRKLEGAEILLSYETNFFRQELHKWCPVAPEPPPILQVSLSTRKPRPTKLQKMLVEYGVDNPDDLPEHAKGKANSLRRKAANAEAAAAAAQATSAMPSVPNPHNAAYGPQAYFSRASHSTTPSISANSHGHGDEKSESASENDGLKLGSAEAESNLHPSFLRAGSSHLAADDSSMSLEERFMRGQDDADKNKDLGMFTRSELGRDQAEGVWGSDVWSSRQRSMSEHGRSMTPADLDENMKHDDGKVDQMFKEMTNQDEDEDQKKKDTTMTNGNVTADLLESERNGLDAMLDGE